MTLIGEIEEAARNTLDLGGIKSLHTLSVRDSEIITAMNHQNWSIPVADEIMG